MTAALPRHVTRKYLKSLVLIQGNGSGGDGDRCAIQEVRHWLKLDASTDAIPPCVDPVIGRMVIALNDHRAEWRKALVPLLPKIIGTRVDAKLTRKRAYRAADWAVRECAAGALRHAGLEAEAKKLESLPPVVDRKTAAAATNAAYAANYAAYAANAADPAADPVALLAEVIEMR